MSCDRNPISKKKILFLIHTLQVGGAERVLVNLVNNLNPEKYDITVMTVINTGAFRDELNGNIKYDSIINLDFLKRKGGKKKANKKSGNLFDKAGFVKKIASRVYEFVWRHKNCAKVYEKAIKDKYDIEVAFLEGISTKIIANSNNEDSKKIAWVHVDLLGEKKSEHFYRNIKEERKTYLKFNRIVCVSEQVRDSIKKKLGVNNNLSTEYNPIDSDRIIGMSEEKIDDVIKNDKTVICSVGRLSNQKAFGRLINCVGRLKKEQIDVDLWIIGVGEKEKELQKSIKQLGLSNVKMLGYQKNPYKYIKKADIYACSSIAEGFSTVVSEAVILEKPIVTTDCSGMKEILGSNSEYGLICANNEDALYAGLKKMITDSETFKIYQRVIKQRKEIFDFRKSIERIEAIFDEQLMKEKRNEEKA